MLVKARGEVQAVSASRLTDGTAVWLGPDHEWVEDVTAAGAFRGADIQAALAKAKADMDARLVVDVYPLDVEVLEDGRTRPLHIRERMKGLGPSVRADLGLQARTPAAPTL